MFIRIAALWRMRCAASGREAPGAERPSPWPYRLHPFPTQPNPNTLPLRPDRSPVHPNLVSRKGFVCEHCLYRTTSIELVKRHLSKGHDRRGAKRKRTWLQDEIYSNVVLQNWTQNGARKYWIAAPSSDHPMPVRREHFMTSHDLPNFTRTAMVHQIQQAERYYIARLAAGHPAMDGIGRPDMAIQTNWMRRTGWQRMFEGDVRRDLLAKLTLIASKGDRQDFGVYQDGIKVFSSAEDERQLCRIVTALDELRQRCEDTVRHTDVSIRCWLRSNLPDRTHQKPFELVALESTRIGYWRLIQRFVCFTFRLWRLPRAVRRSIRRRPMTQAQRKALRTAWSAVTEEGTPDPSRDIPRATGVAWQGAAGYATDEEGSDDIRNHSDQETDPELYDEDEDDDEEEDPYLESDSDLDGSEWTSDGEDVRDRQVENGLHARLLGHLLQLVGFFVTEAFEDGRADSTLLVYFSGVLGICEDGVTFAQPRHYTPKLSALIYCARLITLQLTPPRFAYKDIGLEARPRHYQLARLNILRTKALCLGSQAPVGELLSLRDYGRVLAKSNGPVFRVSWSADGQMLSWDNGQITMAQFRALSSDLVGHVSSASYRLMYGWQPAFDLGVIHDRMSTYSYGYSILTDERNQLAGAYLGLSERACMAQVDGLIGEDGWDRVVATRYLALHDKVLEDILLPIHLTSGQAPRGTELLCLEHRNSASTARGVHSVIGCSFGTQVYRQLSIAITEKHIRQISKPFNFLDDKSKDADAGAAFAWQSGHRPWERAITYGLDMAFPDSLQPSLTISCQMLQHNVTSAFEND
ncbi:hypothetical protein JX266_014045 [Neoarthrinium moseri]|nr:hypothetical protein JX266_014045 [Neoarthrinium moseri]